MIKTTNYIDNNKSLCVWDLELQRITLHCKCMCFTLFLKWMGQETIYCGAFTWYAFLFVTFLGRRATYNYRHLWMVHWFRTRSVKSLAAMTAVCTARTDEVYSQRENGSAWLCLRKASPRNARNYLKCCEVLVSMPSVYGWCIWLVSLSKQQQQQNGTRFIVKICDELYLLLDPPVSGQLSSGRIYEVWNHCLNINPACSAQKLNIQGYQYGVFWALTCVNMVKTAHFQRNEFSFSSGKFDVLEDSCQLFISET